MSSVPVAISYTSLFIKNIRMNYQLISYSVQFPMREIQYVRDQTIPNLY